MGTILINNGFNGEFVAQNLGHEIINLLQADNGGYYIFVAGGGTIPSYRKPDNIKYVLFTTTASNNSVKILAASKTKKYLTEGNPKWAKSNNIKYCGIDFAELFRNNIWHGLPEELSEDANNKNRMATYECEWTKRPKKDFVISANKDLEGAIPIEKKPNNQSQRVYISEKDMPDSYKALIKIIEKDGDWERIGKSKPPEPKRETFLSIVKKEYDENIISNMLAYFWSNDLDLWKNTAESLFGLQNEAELPEIIREKENNIDLFIRTRSNNLIVIENKIKSKINGRSKENIKDSQLKKYHDYAMKYAAENKKIAQKDVKFYLLRPNYLEEDYKKYIKGKEYKLIEYKKIFDILNKHKSSLPFYDELKAVVGKHASDVDNAIYDVMHERLFDVVTKTKNEKK